MILEDKTILVTGGTGSMGRTFVRRALAGEWGTPRKIIVFSRDEAKQHDMRMAYLHKLVATDEVIYRNFMNVLEFRIGDVHDYADICSAVRNADIVVNAAALKQVPACEYFPTQAVLTNCMGASNIVRAIEENGYPVETVIGISTDKACKPVNVMGMTKAIQERVYIVGNLRAPQTRFICARYGNVLASRGSVVPLFLDQIAAGGPVTITTPDMTRFLLTLEDAVDTILAAVRAARPGQTYIPRCPSAKMTDLAGYLIGDRDIETVITGIRPGEKVHEILLSEEEATRTVHGHEGYYALEPMLPELAEPVAEPALIGEYSSAGALMSPLELAHFLETRIPEVIGEIYLEA